jgi:hypothetical protein
MSLKGRIKGYHLRKLVREDGQVFRFRMIAIRKNRSGALPGKFHRLLTACLINRSLFTWTCSLKFEYEVK